MGEKFERQVNPGDSLYCVNEIERQVLEAIDAKDLDADKLLIHIGLIGNNEEEIKKSCLEYLDISEKQLKVIKSRDSKNSVGELCYITDTEKQFLNHISEKGLVKDDLKEYIGLLGLMSEDEFSIEESCLGFLGITKSELNALLINKSSNPSMTYQDIALDRLGLSGHNIDKVKEIYFWWEKLSDKARAVLPYLEGSTDVIKSVIDCDDVEALEIISKADSPTLQCLSKVLFNTYDIVCEEYSKLELTEITPMLERMELKLHEHILLGDYKDALDELERIIILQMVRYDAVESVRSLFDFSEVLSPPVKVPIKAPIKEEAFKPYSYFVKTKDFSFYKIDSPSPITNDILEFKIKDLPFWIKNCKMFQVFENNDGNIGKYVGFFRSAFKENKSLITSLFKKLPKSNRTDVNIVVRDGRLLINSGYLKQQFGSDCLTRTYMCRDLENKLRYLGDFNVSPTMYNSSTYELLPTNGSKKFSNAILNKFYTKKTVEEDIIKLTVGSYEEILNNTKIEGNARSKCFSVDGYYPELFGNAATVLADLSINNVIIGSVVVEDRGIYIRCKAAMSGECNLDGEIPENLTYGYGKTYAGEGYEDDSYYGIAPCMSKSVNQRSSTGNIIDLSQAPRPPRNSNHLKKVEDVKEEEMANSLEIID